MLADPPKEEKRVWKCENRQLDPKVKNYVNHFGQSSPENGSRERKIRFQTREVQKLVRFQSMPSSPSLPASSPT